MKGFLGHKQHASGPAPSGQELHDERVAIHQAHITINEKTQLFRDNFTAFNLQIPETIDDIKPCESRIEEHIQATGQRKAESIAESQRMTQVIDTTAKERDLQHFMHLKSMDVVKTFKAPAMKTINNVHLRAIAIPSTELVHTKIYEDVCRLHDIEDFDIILKKTPNVNEKSSLGRNPLDYAAQYSFKYGIESLIQNEALCSDAFIYVLLLDLPEAVKLLVEITADLIGHKEIFDKLSLDNSVIFLNLPQSGLVPESIVSLSQSLKENHSINLLNISDNIIGDVGSQALGELLFNNEVITKLDISNGQISKEGIKYITTSLEGNKVIKCLNISGNKIGDVGSIAVANLIERNLSLIDLNVSEMLTLDIGAAYIIDRLVHQNQSILHINLANNNITDALAEDILEILPKTHSVVSFNIASNHFNPSNISAITEIISKTTADNIIQLTLGDLIMDVNTIELLAEVQAINDFE